MQIVNVLLLCFIIFIVFILSFAEKKFTLKYKKRILFFIITLISIICGIRVIGLDLESYRKMFIENNIVSLDINFFRNMFSTSLEPFFVLLISLIKQMGLGFKTFLFISAVIPMYLLYSLIIKKEKELPFVTFLFFLLMVLFRGPVDTVRHFFAAVVYLSALYSLANGKKFSFYLKSALSALIHYSNIAIFFVRPFLKIKWSIGKYIITLLFFSLLAFIGKQVFVDFIAGFSFKNPILWKLQYYLVYSKERYVYFNAVHQIMWYLMTFTIVVFNVIVNIVALAQKERIIKDKFYHLLLNSQIVGSIMVLVFTAADAATMGLRLNFLFSIGSFFLVKELIFGYTGNKKAVNFFITVLFLCFYNFIIILYFAGIFDPNSAFSIV